MKSKNVIKDKSYQFAIRVVKCYQYLNSEKRDFVLSKQLLRSGTSVGAMIREAEHAQSKADFIHKLSIAQKEINESIYWIDLITDTEYLTSDQSQGLMNDANEIIKILTSIIKTSKSK